MGAYGKVKKIYKIRLLSQEVRFIMVCIRDLLRCLKGLLLMFLINLTISITG